jgi:probable rRNA maturation factor
VTVAFVNNAVIKELNLKFRKKDKPTDVLSFPMKEEGANGKYYLGDIIISVPQAFKQCFNREHNLERELELLTLHGFLHLAGFEHDKGIEEEEEKMRGLFLKD